LFALVFVFVLEILLMDQLDAGAQAYLPEAYQKIEHKKEGKRGLNGVHDTWIGVRIRVRVGVTATVRVRFVQK
jgi:hypothetical protein